jgi:hypothetical protein
MTMNARIPELAQAAGNEAAAPLTLAQIGLDQLFSTCEQLQKDGRATDALALG